MKLSVVIPCYNHWELTHQLLFDLFKFCINSLDEVIVANDASTDKEVYTGLGFWKSKMKFPMVTVESDENQGFTLTANMGMKKASGDILVLISNDVRVRTDICKQIRDIIEQDAKVLIGNTLIDFDSGWNTFDGKIYKYLDGSLLACTREVWEDLGGFDKIYSPGDFEDVDISTKAVELGYTLVSTNNDLVWHLAAQTTGYTPERLERTKRNQKRFAEKWIK